MTEDLSKARPFRVEALAFGMIVQGLRERHGMTQDQLAAAAKCSNSMICKIERGAAMPDVDLEKRLIRKLGITLAQFKKLSNMSLERACRATVAVLPSVKPEDWFRQALELVGLAGLRALIALGASAVLAECHSASTPIPLVR